MPAVRDERRTAILNAAAEVFLEQGYAAASIDAVIEKVGGSKRNIYTLFGNKEGLFIALISQCAEQASSEMSFEGASHLPLEDALRQFALRFLNLFMSPVMVGVYRGVVGEAHRLPHLAEAFYENGPKKGARRLAAILSAAAARGDIQVDDPLYTATQFIGMLRSNLHLEIVLGLREPLSRAEIDTVADTSVALFLGGLLHPEPAAAAP
ncbi:TetR/AcrR family transcriptional regulator [Rhizobium sp. PAMB 3182]